MAPVTQLASSEAVIGPHRHSVAAERELPYAGLHLLCAPLLDNGLALPAAHRTTLAAVLTPGLTLEIRQIIRQYPGIQAQVIEVC
jgi:hypothetical protein